MLVYNPSFIALNFFICLIFQYFRAQLYIHFHVCLTIQDLYDHHLRATRRIYAQKVALLGEAIGRHFPAGTRVTRPKGGFALWVELPPGCDSMRLYGLAIREGITIAPGPIFSATGKFRNYLRINAAFWSERTEGAIQTLGRLAAELIP